MGIRGHVVAVGLMLVAGGCQRHGPPALGGASPWGDDAAGEPRGFRRGSCVVGPLRPEVALGVSVCAELKTGPKGQLLDGGVLHSDDALWLRVEATQRLHFYLVQEQHGEAKLVWPERLAKAPELLPSEVQDLPFTKGLELDDRPGSFVLHIIASAEPLERAAPQLYAELDRINAAWGPVPRLRSPAAPSVAGAWSTQTVPGLERGGGCERGVVVRHPESGMLTAELDADGVAEAVFHIEHRRRPP